jgi:hypothetical protein
MHCGLNMECDDLQGKTEAEAFQEVFAQVDLAAADACCRAGPARARAPVSALVRGAGGPQVQ